jgi:hypothetical protein
MKWTEDKVSRLKLLVEKDLTDQQIAQEIGVSKQAILAKRTKLFLNKRSGKFSLLSLSEKIKITRDRNAKYQKKAILKNPQKFKDKWIEQGNKYRNKIIIGFQQNEREPYWKYRLIRIKKNAIKRKIEFNLSISDLENIWLKQKGRCFYSDIDLKPFVTGESWANKEKLISVDRIDPNKGYEKNNIQFTSHSINTAKLEMSHTDFINLCKKVSKRF